jgi:hypothetical protein
MRRAARSAVAVGIFGFLGASRIAEAGPWTVTMEGGAEADSNVARVETGSGLPNQRVTAPVGRAGARIGHRGQLLGGGYSLAASGLGRWVASGKVDDERVMLYTVDARWLHAVESRPVAVGVAVTAADAFAITGGTGARTFRNFGGDAMVVLGSGDDRHLTLAAGGRDFSYKPDHKFDWRGPVANARLDIALWRGAARSRSLELTTILDIEARAYASIAQKNVCPPGAPPSTDCSANSTPTRADRFQRASIDLTWTGDVVATAGYQLTVVDSNSYGQSLTRHRVMTSVTAELADKLFGSATATLQLDQYRDGRVVGLDIQHIEFTNLEDENRSSLQVRLARELSTSWSLEARAAMWRDFDTTGTASFRRELVYAGIIYSL